MNNLSKIKRIFASPAIRAIWRWTKCVHRQIALICLIGVSASLFSLGLTLVTRSLIDAATSADASTLWTRGAQLVVLMGLERLLSVLASHLRIKTGAKLQKTMQSMVTSSIMGKEYAALKSYHSGELVNRIFSDVSVVKNGAMSILPSILRTAVSFVGAAIILISMDWRFVPVLILAAFIGLGLMLAFREPMKKRHARMQAAEDALHASTQETVENIRVIKASSSEERLIGRMDEDRSRLSAQQISNGRLSIAMNQGMGAMFDISWLACNLWGCIKIYHGTFTYGSLAAMIQLVGRIQSPIANAVSLVSQIYGVVSSAERLMEVVDLQNEEQGVALASFDEICLDKVNFQYDDGMEDVLTDVSCTIRRGDFVALTGISGGGKTSLFQLLLGIYKPSSGSVTFVQGEQHVRACRGTRALFAYVPQGNMLFSGTLRSNLTMFTDSASDAEIEEALKAACIDGLAREIGLDAVLGERGVGLSEGQAQRVAVARALLSKAPILLLDEATSALDEETEAKMLKNISAMRDKTCVIVTHRRAALDICDYTMHISGGRMTRFDRAHTV